MSIESEHIKQFFHNSDFYNSINTDKYPDWAIVVIFYKGIHLIESVMARTDNHSQSHYERKKIMLDNSEIFSRDLRKDYYALEGLSRKARYMPEYIIGDKDIKMATEYLDTINSWYNNLKPKNN